MSLSANSAMEPARAIGAAAAWRARARSPGAVLGVLPPIGGAMRAAGCGGESSGRAVTVLSAAPSVSKASLLNRALGFAQSMRTHSEPHFPDPAREGGGVQETIIAGSGVNPRSPQFSSARNACEHLLPNNGVPAPSQAQTITPAERADYLQAAGRMRSHGVLDFPDPTFQNDSVTVNSSSPIDTISFPNESALTTCRKLIPAGLLCGASSDP